MLNRIENLASAGFFVFCSEGNYTSTSFYEEAV